MGLLKFLIKSCKAGIDKESEHKEKNRNIKIVKTQSA